MIAKLFESHTLSSSVIQIITLTTQHVVVTIETSTTVDVLHLFQQANKQTPDLREATFSSSWNTVVNIEETTALTSM